MEIPNTGDADKVNVAADSSLYDFFKIQLREMYKAEKCLSKALLKIRDAATNEDLRNELNDHIAETEKQITRIEEIFRIMNLKPQTEKCPAIDALIAEAETVIEQTENGSSTRDAALIVAVQKIEHYEIGTYGGLVQFATNMGFETIAELLGQTLQEEKDTDILLSDIADKKVNWLAETEGKTHLAK